ncbi:MAG: M1 family metallopeptidase [Acidobacteriaceae bacterium]|nr:M1 family metallopeptidase [Acidobacteriaceae bacterium]
MAFFPRRLFAPCTVLAALATTALAADEPPKLRLPDTVAPTSYRVELKLDPTKDTFTGHIAIKVDIKQPVQTIWLNASHIDVSDATLNAGGRHLAAKALPGGDDFVGLQFESTVPTGEGEIEIQYTGHVRQQDSSGVFHMTEDGHDYLFTQFESTDARAAFPCFDEPSYKVPWQLTLSVPQKDDAVSNTPTTQEETRGADKVYTFKQTKPLPSYLIAFAVGEFDFVPAGYVGKNRAPVRIITPKGLGYQAKYTAEITATILEREEQYFGIPYPYEKSDQLAIPTTFGFGAMENAGLVTYAQTILLGDPKRDTIRRQRECASVEAHELAHQWFGDLVTTAWWNDIWLNEAFASWMEQKVIAEWHPEWQTRVEDVQSKLGAMRQDSLISARKIRQEIKTKDDISNAFDSITYNKGAAVIRMFESWIGSEEFRKGVHGYLTRYAFKNATATDFLDAIGSATKKDVTTPFSTFLNQAGVPMVTVSLECNQGSGVLHMEQQRYLPLGSKGSTDQIWQVPVCARWGTGETGTDACTLMTEAKTDWKLKGSGCPAWVEANDEAVGYYRVNYQSSLLADLTKGDVDKRLNAAERVDFLGNADALTTGGKLPAADALGLVPVFRADPERNVVQTSLNLALAPYAHLVPEDLMPNYRRFLQKNFDARARELGWTPKPGESDNTLLLRPLLLRTMATRGRDEELAKEGRELTDKWLEDHNSIDPNMVNSVIDTGAYYGDKSLFERFLGEYKKSKDRQEQERIVEAMAFFRDPAAIEAGMNAVLNGDIPAIQGLYVFLYMGQREPSTRHMAFDFMKAHFDELAAKRPTGGGFDGGALFPEVGASFCSEQEKEELKSFFEPRIDKFTGGPRTLSNVLEEIDVCTAEKSAQESSVEAFLKKY